MVTIQGGSADSHGEWLVYLMPLTKFHLLLILIGAWDGTHSHGDTPGSLVKASQMKVHPSSGRRGEAASNLVTHACNPNTWKTEAGRSGF